MERVNKSESINLTVEFAENGYVLRIPDEGAEKLLVLYHRGDANPYDLSWAIGRKILDRVDAIGDEMTNVMGAKVKNYELFINATVNGLKEESKDNQENK